MISFFATTFADPIWKRLSADWHDDFANWIRDDLPRLIVILIIAFVLLRLLSIFSRKLQEFSNREELPSHIRARQLRTLASVIHGGGVVVIYFVALLEILEVFKINVGPFLASAGIAGLAIGFGAQTLVHDVINGFFIVLDNIYDIGDVVKLGSVQGTVEHMSLRMTVLRDDTGTVHSVPNSAIQIISNMTRDWAQVALHVSVDYGESSDRIIGLLREVGKELENDPEFGPYIVAAPDVPGIDRVNGSEVDYLMVSKVRPGKQYAVKRELRRRIKECFEKNKIKAGSPNRMYVMEPPPASVQN
ncbi:MAG TPA: mechanosensitive ion channel family protein [Terriglobales bacterium]|nr:mechanosensitive ion channel family protein [Terriglobales bacterium]